MIKLNCWHQLEKLKQKGKGKYNCQFKWTPKPAKSIHISCFYKIQINKNQSFKSFLWIEISKMMMMYAK